MKKYTLLLLMVFMMSCKSDSKEPTCCLEKPEKKATQNMLDETYLLIDISLNLVNRMGRKEFTNQCLPIINRLYKQDSAKYKMVQPSV